MKQFTVHSTLNLSKNMLKTTRINILSLLFLHAYYNMVCQWVFYQNKHV